jgi:hypothetical protein
MPSTVHWIARTRYEACALLLVVALVMLGVWIPYDHPGAATIATYNECRPCPDAEHILLDCAE